MTTSTREQFRQTLATLADKARAALPAQVNGRIESAVRLVLQGDVEPQEDGAIRVGSSDPTRYYRLEGLTCTCTDYTQEKAPGGWCKHRIAAGLHKRLGQMLAAEVPCDPTTPAEVPVHTQGPGSLGMPAQLPEAPASLNFKAMVGGFETQITLRDSDESRLLARLQDLLKDQRIRPLPKPAPRPQGQWKNRRDSRYQGA